MSRNLKNKYVPCTCSSVLFIITNWKYIQEIYLFDSVYLCATFFIVQQATK